MNLLAYHTTSLALKVLTAFSRARVSLHNSEDMPAAGTIFVINHFTRLETLLLPYHISKLLGKPVWSLASDELFNGLLGRYLDKVGAVSVQDPERDNLIIKSLLSESAAWIIFPEGHMVKNRKVIDRGNFTIVDENGRHAPYTGAMALALKAEILRQRWRALKEVRPDEDDNLLATFDISPTTDISAAINLVPVNVTYYPLRSADNLLHRFSNIMEEKISERLLEEILVEGSMLLDGVDIDIRFGQPVSVEPFVRRIFGRKIPELVDDRYSRSAIRRMTNCLMASIYNQTTVNLDHIIASLLYKTRGAKFTEAELRYRAFLVATSARLQPIYFRHRSLKKSQVDLLLEKEGGRITELLDFAREKSLLHDLDRHNLIFSDPEGTCDGHAFHRIRVDNPFCVMANTVEPLRALQRLLTKVNWLPAWYLKRLTAKRLLRIMEQTYIDARQTLKGEPELMALPGGMPYLVKPRRAKAGIVLIHDWLQTPSSLKKLADYLGAHGFLVIVPRLPGHATIPADLKDRTFDEWQTAVDEAYVYVSLVCSEVVVCGVGNSVALALSLAERSYEMAALVALFPAVTGVTKTSSELKPADSDEQVGAEVTAKSPVCGYTYPSFPVTSKRQVKKMLVQAAKNLPLIKTPLLLLHDETISKADRQQMDKYFAKISSHEKELLLLSTSDPNTMIRKDQHGGQALVDFIKRNLY